MSTIIGIIKRLFPEGTRATSSKSWKLCPLWPPDLFAVSATLVNLSGCYSEARFTASEAKRFLFTDEYRRRVVKLGKAWTTKAQLPVKLQPLWDKLVKSGAAEIDDSLRALGLGWREAAMELMAISDEACEAVGFYPPPENTIALIVLARHHAQMQSRRSPIWLPHLPHSLCILVPPNEVCVQPKTLTPQVGCTLRSFSHHLALLPPKGIVATSWRVGESTDSKSGDYDDHLNLLCIPFPFSIGSADIQRQGMEGHSEKTLETHHFFDIRQNWLSFAGKSLSAKKIVDELIAPLIAEANEEFKSINGVILPELALTRDLANQVAKRLAKIPHLELFVSGIFVPPTSGEIPNNAAATFLFYKGNMLTNWVQRKHHRWCLDESQIRRYRLAHVLPPKRRFWWERIDVASRECHFHTVRSGVSVAVLICEDLARFDPVQPALLAVGPNLVISLLMDGPQMEGRWPGRYATVLADDPGSAVLTLTSLGMVRRSTDKASPHAGKIALWKHFRGGTEELKLPEDCHALVLSTCCP